MCDVLNGIIGHSLTIKEGDKMKTRYCMILYLFFTILAFSEILYFSGETPENDYELFMYDTTTNKISQLTHLKGFISGFDLSEDGQKVYFGLLSTQKNGLYELNLKSGEINPVLVDSFNNRQPCVIKKDKLIFVSYREKKESLFLLDLNTFEIEPFIILEGYEFSPVLSPDKQLLVFVHSEDTYEHDGQMFLYDMNTREMKNLSGDVLGDYSPAFSPNSQEIIFSSFRERGQQAIFRMDLTSTKTEKITNIFGTTDRFPVYNKSGDWIYFTTLKGTYKIARMNSKGSDREILNVYPDD